MARAWTEPNRMGPEPWKGAGSCLIAMESHYVIVREEMTKLCFQKIHVAPMPFVQNELESVCKERDGFNRKIGVACWSHGNGGKK